MKLYLLSLGLCLSSALIGCGPDAEGLDTEIDTLWDEWSFWTGHPAVGRPGNGVDAECSAELHRITGNCTYTLIGTKTVLGAAHCGTRQTHFKMCNDTTPVKASISQHVDHPEYSGPTPHDFQLKQLSRVITEVTPIPFNQDSRLITAGLGVTFVGLGNGEGGSAMKRRGINEIKQVPSDILMRFYNRAEAPSRGFATEGAGDSGGPSLITDHGVEVVAGVWRGGATQNRTDGVHGDWLMETSNFNARPSPPFGSLAWKQIRKAGTNQCLFADEVGLGKDVKLGRCGDAGDRRYRWDLVLATSGPQAGLFVIRNRFNRHRCLKFVNGDFKLDRCRHKAADTPMSLYEADSGRFMLISRNSDQCVGAMNNDVRAFACRLTDARMMWEIR